MEHLERELRDVLSDDRLSLPTHLVDLEHVHTGARRRRRRHAVAATAAGVVVLAACVAGVGLLQNGGRSTAPPVASSSPAPTPTSTPTPSPSEQLLGPAWGDAEVTSVTATSDRTLVVLGAMRDKAGCPTGPCVRLAESHDGGATFSTLPLPQGVRDVTDVRFGSADDGWLFGGGFWATHDGGHTWKRLAGGPPPSRLEAASGTAWALIPAGGDRQQLWSSPVGEDDWRPVDGVTVTAPADLAVQGDRVTVVGANRSAAWSNASGEFAQVPNPCGPALETHLSASGSIWATCVTGTAAYLATSRDGTTWTTVPVDTGQGALPNSVVVGARTSGEAVAWIGNGDTGLARVTTDGAVTTLPDVGTGVSWLGFTDPRVGYAVTCCSIRGLLRTDDGGETWRMLEPSAARHE